MTVYRKLALDAAIVLQYGTVNQSTVRGINRITLPSLMRTKITSEEMRNSFSVHDTGGGEHGDFSYGGNMVTGDTLGQDQIRTYLKNNTRFTDARIYLDLTDFIAPDTATATAAGDVTGFQVLSHTPNEAQRNSTYSFSGVWIINGPYCYFDAHNSSAYGAIAFVEAGSGQATITDSGSKFVTDGFKAGDTIIIEGSTSNDGQYIIDTVAAGVITLTSAYDLTSEAAISGTAIHGGQL